MAVVEVGVVQHLPLLLASRVSRVLIGVLVLMGVGRGIVVMLICVGLL